ncbi:MAG TPA: methyltransferase domain-containing protein [Thermoanaerobaculia bacterium]|nr:methyltransferase domain-containing protein [Thermoanaerobaculia bacterium]
MVTLLCTVRDCRARLVREPARAVCERGHSFDVARSGYINLLQPQDRRAKNPGDSAEVVAARRRFLDRYAVPVDLSHLPAPTSLLDVGCGEGHYLGAAKAQFDCEAHGVDISIPAIDAAARAHRDCTFVVANADRFLPYATASFDLVMSINARLNPPEFRRVLHDGGTLVVSILGADDLRELRTGPEQHHVERTVALFASTFHLIRHETVRRTVHLDREAIRDALLSSYRGMREVPDEERDVTLSRDVLVFQ